MSGQVADSAIRFDARLETARHAQAVRHQPIPPPSSWPAPPISRTTKTSRPTPRRATTPTLAAVRNKSYDTLRAEHIADHQALFRRVSLDLGTTPAAKLPTDERIDAFATGNDPALVALLFQYGRYLMIGSSRPGGQPANLQGIWNDSNNPPGTASTPTTSIPK